MISAPFWWIVRLFALGVSLCLLLRGATGDRFMAVRLFTYFTPWVLLTLLAALPFAVTTKRTGTALLLCVPAAAILLSYAPLFTPRSAPTPPPEGSFTVMSFNIWSKNKQIDDVAALIREESPDIALLQEVVPDKFPKLRDALRDLYPDAAFAPELMQAVLSRFPLERCDSYRTKGQAQRVVVMMPQFVLTVFNVHPLRRGGWTNRHGRMARLLSEELLPSGGAAIVAGDLNTTEGSQTYRLLAGHLGNAHREGGRGFGFTYPAGGVRWMGVIAAPAMVRIDHIFFSRELKVHRAATVRRSAGSDHRPVTAVLYPASPSPSPLSPAASGGGPLTCIERD